MIRCFLILRRLMHYFREITRLLTIQGRTETAIFFFNAGLLQNIHLRIIDFERLAKDCRQQNRLSDLVEVIVWGVKAHPSAFSVDVLEPVLELLMTEKSTSLMLAVYHAMEVCAASRDMYLVVVWRKLHCHLVSK